MKHLTPGPARPCSTLSWGPHTDGSLRAGLLTLTAMPGTPTLNDLPRLLIVPAFRARARDQIDDMLKGFWSWFDNFSEASRAQVIAPLKNKNDHSPDALAHLPPYLTTLSKPLEFCMPYPASTLKLGCFDQFW